MVRVKWMKRRGGRFLLIFRYILYCAGIWLHLLVMTGMLAGLGCGPGGAKSSFEVEKNDADGGFMGKEPWRSERGEKESWKRERSDAKGKKKANGGNKQNKETKKDPVIRVLLMTNGYQGIQHSRAELVSPAGMILEAGEERWQVEGGQSLSITPGDERVKDKIVRVWAKDGGEITVNSIDRAYGKPSYEGTVEIRCGTNGLILINELPVERYLCKVVPSEMPPSYELEALKVQAVCARSYAYRQMASYGYPEYEVHVDDSTAYQVYGNSKPQERSTQAVNATCGEVVMYHGQIATTYYYSTSCGETTSLEAWGTPVNDENGYLQAVEVSGKVGDYEKDLPWYRWEAAIPVQTLSTLVEQNLGKGLGMIRDIQVTKKGPGGVVLQIKLIGENGDETVDTENKIRAALGGNGYEIKKQDGGVVPSSKLLPSAFFTVEKGADIFVIKGGGYGHGIGMSQNGANEMAKEGRSYEEIVEFFFRGAKVQMGTG